MQVTVCWLTLLLFLLLVPIRGGKASDLITGTIHVNPVALPTTITTSQKTKLVTNLKTALTTIYGLSLAPTLIHVDYGNVTATTTSTATTNASSNGTATNAPASSTSLSITYTYHFPSQQSSEDSKLIEANIVAMSQMSVPRAARTEIEKAIQNAYGSTTTVGRIDFGRCEFIDPELSLPTASSSPITCETSLSLILTAATSFDHLITKQVICQLLTDVSEGSDCLNKVNIVTSNSPVYAAKFQAAVSISTLTDVSEVIAHFISKVSTIDNQLGQILDISVQGTTLYSSATSASIGASSSSEKGSCSSQLWWLVFLILILPLIFIALRYAYRQGKRRGIEKAREEVQEQMLRAQIHAAVEGQQLQHQGGVTYAPAPAQGKKQMMGYVRTDSVNSSQQPQPQYVLAGGQQQMTVQQQPARPVSHPNSSQFGVAHQQPNQQAYMYYGNTTNDNVAVQQQY